MTPLGLVLVPFGLLLAVAGSYVALDFARRTQALRTHAGVLWLAGAGAAFAVSLWAIQVIGFALDPRTAAAGYDLGGALATLVGAWALGIAALFMVTGRLATPGPMALAAVGLGLGLVALHVHAWTVLGLSSGLVWRWSALAVATAGAIGGAMISLGAWLRVGDGHRPGRIGWQVAAAGVLGLTLVASRFLVAGSLQLGPDAAPVRGETLSPLPLLALATVGAGLLIAGGLLFSMMEARLRRSLRRAEVELQRRSFRDPLTRLPNRLMFEGLLAQAVQQAGPSHERLALLFVDLDGFKPVNETLGHHAGDRMLREIAGRIKTYARSDDCVAHLGADEFLLLVRGDPTPEAVVTYAERLQTLVAQPCRIGERDASVTCSVGIALYPTHGTSATLIAHAEAAMRAAKSGGGATHCFYEERMTVGVREQFDLLRDLRLAIAENQLELAYQPKVHAPSGEITGAEALIRWTHPRRGIVGPDVFIPIAERFGLIGAIGNWMIEEACRQAAEWRDQGLRMRVSVNLSAHQLRHDDLADRIGAALRRHRVSPHLITCEITESVAMEDASNAIRMVERLGAMGLNISIDDFGTGYSSLAYLRKLNAGELKIDRSFVLDIETSSDARAVVDAVVRLAQALGLKVVAEGVETEGQHQVLRALGCHELQGYLFAKPMSPSALAAWAIPDAAEGRSLEFRESLFRATAPAPLH